jgi:phage shock protein C
VGSGDIPMAGAARRGRLDGMNLNTDIPTDVPAAGPSALTTDPAPLPSTPTPSSQFRLRRSRTDRMLGGVTGGLAESLGADAALLRVLVVALTLITGGAAALVYLAAWVLAPEA